MAEKLRVEALAPLLPSMSGADLEVYETIDSTNLRCKTLAAQGAAAGTAVAADCQTAGRGSRGRSFSSPEGQGVYLSVLLRPGCRAEEMRHLTAMAAVAIREAIVEACGLETGIKWVNDLVCNGRKLCGILVELAFAPDGTVSSAVVGAGVNCSQRLEDFPPELQEMAGSVQMFTGVPVDRTALCAAMIRRLRALQEKLFSGREEYLRRYAEHCVTIGGHVRILGEPEREAEALGIDENAALMVRYEDGSEDRIASGEVSVRGLYGYLNH